MYKLSQWHDGSVKPEHEGIYEDKGNFYYYWNGEFWEYGGLSCIRDLKRDSRKSPIQNKRWRGIVK